MHGVAHDLDVAELGAAIGSYAFVMIAGDENDLGTGMRLAQEPLHDLVLGLRPIPALLEPPDVEDVAYQVEAVAVVVPEEVVEHPRLAAPGAEMDVGKPNRAESPWPPNCVHAPVPLRSCTESTGG